MFLSVSVAPVTAGIVPGPYSSTDDFPDELVHVRDLLVNGGSPDQKDSDAMVALHHTAKHGDVEFTLWIINMAADVDIPDLSSGKPQYGFCRASTEKWR